MDQSSSLHQGKENEIQDLMDLFEKKHKKKDDFSLIFYA